MRKKSMLLGIVVLVGSLAIPVFAYDSGLGKPQHYSLIARADGPGYCWQYSREFGDSTMPDQKKKLDELYKNFTKEMAELSSGIWAKSLELDAVLIDPNPDREKARVVQREINDLWDKVTEQSLDYTFEKTGSIDASGDAKEFGSGYGYGCHIAADERSRPLLLTTFHRKPVNGTNCRHYIVW
ncbi:MAG: hypothetical protein JRJ60_07650 [Deltaproteobacteria bacterium]|nr:hypothetical protein [Deltaproteobacteria bacterium]